MRKGVIYTRRINKDGKQHYIHNVFCAICATELKIKQKKHKRNSTFLKKNGWVLRGNKTWICDRCKPDEEEKFFTKKVVVEKVLKHPNVNVSKSTIERLMLKHFNEIFTTGEEKTLAKYTEKSISQIIKIATKRKPKSKSNNYPIKTQYSYWDGNCLKKARTIRELNFIEKRFFDCIEYSKCLHKAFDIKKHLIFRCDLCKKYEKDPGWITDYFYPIRERENDIVEDADGDESMLYGGVSF